MLRVFDNCIKLNDCLIIIYINYILDDNMK